MHRIDCHDSIKRVMGNYDIAFRMVDVLRQRVKPKDLFDSGLELNALRDLSRELHDVYFVRMFSCFESSIRHFWRETVKNTKPPTKQLVNSVADKRGIPDDIKVTVHEIRDFRNYLIHGGHEIVRRFTIKEASQTLNKYLARLPLDW